MFAIIQTNTASNLVPEIRKILTGQITQVSDFNPSLIKHSNSYVNVGHHGQPAWEEVYTDSPSNPTVCIFRSQRRDGLGYKYLRIAQKITAIYHTVDGSSPVSVDYYGVSLQSSGIYTDGVSTFSSPLDTSSYGTPFIYSYGGNGNFNVVRDYGELPTILAASSVSTKPIITYISASSDHFLCWTNANHRAVYAVAANADSQGAISITFYAPYPGLHFLVDLTDQQPSRSNQTMLEYPMVHGCMFKEQTNSGNPNGTPWSAGQTYAAMSYNIATYNRYNYITGGITNGKSLINTLNSTFSPNNNILNVPISDDRKAVSRIPLIFSVPAEGRRYNISDVCKIWITESGNYEINTQLKDGGDKYRSVSLGINAIDDTTRFIVKE